MCYNTRLFSPTQDKRNLPSLKLIVAMDQPSEQQISAAAALGWELIFFDNLAKQGM